MKTICTRFRVTSDRCSFQERQRRFERHLLERRRTILHAFSIQRLESTVERHVIGDEQQMSRIYRDAVHFEHVLNFLRSNQCFDSLFHLFHTKTYPYDHFSSSFDPVRLGYLMNVVTVKFVHVQQLVVLEYLLQTIKYDYFAFPFWFFRAVLTPMFIPSVRKVSLSSFMYVMARFMWGVSYRIALDAKSLKSPVMSIFL